MRNGPLLGCTVLEVGGIGPGPYAGMILADLGADVIRVDRPGATLPFPLPQERDLSQRGKRSVALDLKMPQAVEALMALVARADVLIEGFRPGVAERLGFGPEACHEIRPELVYGRMTGWGQDGPWSTTAGHDINYISVTGALHAIGSADGAPQVPLNLVGDYAGGSSFLVMGVLAALFEARNSGIGQVVDAGIVDGVAHLLSGTHSLMNAGLWTDDRGTNLLDGAAPFYRVYETADGRHMAVGAIEPAFYRELLRVLDVTEDLGEQGDVTAWPHIAKTFAQIFARRTQAEWIALFEGTDACTTPVVSLAEAADHPQVAARGAVTRSGSAIAPGVAPAFSRTPGGIAWGPQPQGTHTSEVLLEAGLDVDRLVKSGAAWQHVSDRTHTESGLNV
jgi:alpha-methylacyl-CoA racemase